MAEFYFGATNVLEFSTRAQESPVYGYSPKPCDNGTWLAYDSFNGWYDTQIPLTTVPTLGANGNWFVAGIDTGVRAIARDGEPGKDGHSPYIGADGIWYAWIDVLERYEPTGIRAQGPQGEPGEVDESKVSEAVADYMGAHPVQIPEEVRDGAAAGATALQPGDLASWAKQPNKPNYTAQEVGALPANTPIPPDVSGEISELKGDLTHKYEKPENGIPASDLAFGVIPDPYDDTAISRRMSYLETELSGIRALTGEGVEE